MNTYYHVCLNWDGGTLESLYAQHGEEAFEIFYAKWPESGNIGQAHTSLIHLHADLNAAELYAATHGGDILEIDGTGLEIEIDDLEYPHPVSRRAIPAENITALK